MWCKLCGERYVAESMWSKLRGAINAVQAPWAPAMLRRLIGNVTRGITRMRKRGRMKNVLKCAEHRGGLVIINAGRIPTCPSSEDAQTSCLDQGSVAPCSVTKRGGAAVTCAKGRGTEGETEEEQGGGRRRARRKRGGRRTRPLQILRPGSAVWAPLDASWKLQGPPYGPEPILEKVSR